MPLPDAPTLHLAFGGQAEGTDLLCGERGIPPLPKEMWPSLLISFVYLKRWLPKRKVLGDDYAMTGWILDSGAFSAKHLGFTIELQEYIDCCKALMDEDGKLREIIALDNILDWRETRRNTEEMWKQGIPAIPCYHLGEPEDVLLGYAKDYPKIALGGIAKIAGKQKKIDWALQCFSRVWPKPIHGFAVGFEEMIMAVPWHSVDASSWLQGPAGFGRWPNFRNQMLSVPSKSPDGRRMNVRASLEHFMRLQDRARRLWKNELSPFYGRDFLPREVPA